jgi:hypothetical protein
VILFDDLAPQLGQKFKIPKFPLNPSVNLNQIDGDQDWAEDKTQNQLVF